MTPAPESRLEDWFDLVRLPSNGPVHLAAAIPNARLRSAPGFPQAALPESGRVASGRGLSVEECQQSCFGEAVELVSCCDWGDRRLVHESEAALGPQALSAAVLNGFSDAQMLSRESWNRVHAEFDWRPAPRNPASRIDWVAVEDAYGGPVRYIPADFAYIGRRKIGDDAAVAIGNSNGCAAGSTNETAKLSAILELIERDATARWWYGRRQRPVIDLALLDDTNGLITWLGARTRHTRLFDITSDLGVPVVAAASSDSNGHDVALGFAARHDIGEAAVTSLTEMLQIEFSLATARALGRDAGNWTVWRQSVTMALPPLNSVQTAQTKYSGKMRNEPLSLASLLDTFSRAGIGLWFADMTRNVMGLPVIRAISPDLCHIKPRFAPERLLAPDRHDLGPVLVRLEDQVPLLI